MAKNIKTEDDLKRYKFVYTDDVLQTRHRQLGEQYPRYGNLILHAMHKAEGPVPILLSEFKRCLVDHQLMAKTP